MTDEDKKFCAATGQDPAEMATYGDEGYTSADAMREADRKAKATPKE